MEIFSSIYIVWMVLLVVIFFGIVYWAFAKPSENRFDSAAHLPFDDDMIDHHSIHNNQESKHE